MSRVIKFRAWDEDRKKMVYSFKDKGWGKDYRLVHDEEGGKLLCGNYLDNGDWQEPILMQFTGLLDKDNKEIYEGDIVKYFIGHNGPSGDEEVTDEFIEEVQFLDGQFCLDGYVPVNCFPCEVIGNIYENLELLK